MMIRLLLLISLLIFPGLSFGAVHDITGLPITASGWTDFATMTGGGGYSTSRVIFVSSTDGDDGTGTPDTIANVTFDAYGSFQPAGTIHPYATVGAGYTQMRDGYADILLLKRGDNWVTRFSTGGVGNWTKSGASTSARMIVSSYGTGERAKITSDEAGNEALKIYGGDNLIFSSVWFYCPTWESSTPGISVLLDSNDILLEDFFVEKHWKNVIQGDTVNTGIFVNNLAIRRSTFSEMSAHDGMWYAAIADNILFEESIFYKPHDPDALAPAVEGRHFYLSPDGPNGDTHHDLTNVVMRGNILYYSDRGGIDGRSGGLFDNNLFVQAPVNVGGFGGSSGSIQSGTVIRNNVFAEGSANTGEGTKLKLINMLNTEVHHNIFIDPVGVTASTYGITLLGDGEGFNYSHNVSVHDNVIYNINGSGSGRGIYIVGLTDVSGNNIYDNDIQMPAGSTNLVYLDASPLSGFTYSGNRYYSSADASTWFSPGGTIAGWVTAVGETGHIITEITYPDATRTVKTYNVTLGGTASTPEFMAAAIAQSRQNWRTEYTADAVNDYIRAGFGINLGGTAGMGGSGSMGLGGSGTMGLQ